MNSKFKPMGLLPDTQNRGLRMRREFRERFPRHRLQRKPLVSDPGMHHGTWVTHVPWCMSGSLNHGGGGKRSRHSRRMRNSQFYVSGKRPMKLILDGLTSVWIWYVETKIPTVADNLGNEYDWFIDRRNTSVNELGYTCSEYKVKNNRKVWGIHYLEFMYNVIIWV